MKRKWVLLFSVLLIACTGSFAQVSGLSADKLVVFSSNTVQKRHIEFEPAFGYLWSTKSFDHAGKLQAFPDADSTAVVRAMAFRFTYGMAENMEVGCMVAADMSTLSFAIKYKIFQKGNTGGGLFIGSTFANESDYVVRNTGFFGKTASLAGGFILSTAFTEKLSLDVNLQYQNVLNNHHSFSDDVFAGAELGYAIKQDHVIVGGLSYRYNNHKTEKHDAYLLTFNAGLAANVGQSFLFVLSLPFDLIGRNTDRYNGFGVALTLMFN